MVSELAVKILALSLVLGAVAGSIRPSKLLRQVPAAIFVLGNNNYLPGKNIPRADQPYYDFSFFRKKNLMLGVVAGNIRPSKMLQQVPAAAIYVFGDSTLDVGNNNYLPGKNVPRPDRPFYGIDMPGSGKPNGRFSNGYNTADFVAKIMGFMSSPPPYLSLAPSSDNLVLTAMDTGVSYASSGAGILDSTVQYFNATWSKMVASKGFGAVSTLLSRSVFLIGLGGNDLSAFANTQQAQSDVAAFYRILISNYKATITDLYTMGARKYAVINVGLSGCLPVARVLDPTGACSTTRNKLAAGFNDALRSLLAGLAPRLPGLVYSLADSYGIMVDIFADPQASGFTDVSSACCGTGRLGAGGCSPTSTLCANHGQHYFWDGIHPSQRAASLRVQAFYDGPAMYTTPINFKQLVFASGTQ
ncbi:GDSL esterase/lipase [Dichanthelium oligosanthes]|uniref:GDSL esterase/lipase n=1 Tax=Dichanthelium oligosanthes TaxID=888268 RepID=A0A1E5UZ43_9POAL|nr:GDSL esterase/lipase [Dichanthelium oligosanthes]